MVTHGSLFAGIGGFDLGFERAGIETLWTVENDKNCNQVLAAHWPNIKRYGDVREVGKHNLQPVDIISGGFPCQDLSVAGRREGLAGERSGLWFEFARIVEEMVPRWVVVENVPGLLSSAGGRDFATILQHLEELGYCVSWRVLDSQYFGVPQRRRRVFIVGSLGDASSIKILFESEGGEGDIAESGEEGKSVAAPITQSFAKHHGRTAGNNGLADNMLVTNAFHGYTGGADDNDAQARHLVVFDLAQITSNVNRTRVDEGLPAPTLNQAGQTHLAYGGNRTHGPIDVATACNAHGSRRYDFESKTFVAFANVSDGSGARNAGDFAQPVTNRHGDPGSVAGPMGVRRLTPSECERLQGFPDGWTESGLTKVLFWGNINRKNLRRLLSCVLDVELRVAIENLLTESGESASCTIKGSENTELLISRRTGGKQIKNAQCVTGWLDLVGQGGSVLDIINHGSGMVTLYRPNATKGSGMRIERATLREMVMEGSVTLPLLSLSLAESYTRGRESTILTWIKRMILQGTSGSTPPILNICGAIILWGELPRNCSGEESFSLRVADTVYLSDSARYRCLGNAVTVNVAEWIGKRLVAIA